MADRPALLQVYDALPPAHSMANVGVSTEVIAAQQRRLQLLREQLEEQLPVTEFGAAGHLLAIIRHCLAVADDISTDVPPPKVTKQSSVIALVARNLNSIVLGVMRAIVAIGLMVELFLGSVPKPFVGLLFAVYIGLELMHWREVAFATALEVQTVAPFAAKPQLSVPVVERAVRSSLEASQSILSTFAELQRQLQQNRTRHDQPLPETAVLTTLQQLLGNAHRHSPQLAEMVSSNIGLLLSRLNINIVNVNGALPPASLFELEQDESGTVTQITEWKPALVNGHDGSVILPGKAIVPKSRG